MLFSLEVIGQHNELVHVHAPTIPMHSTPATTPITDDGDDLSGMLTGGHLLISFKGSEAATGYHLEVLNEHGKCVFTQDGTSRQGRTFLPLDVTTFQQGRYVVRVQYAGATRHSRFLRP